MTLFQELILISLGKQDQFSRKLTDEDWASLYNEAQRQYLVGILLTGVEKIVALGENKPFLLMQWITKVISLEQRNNLLNQRCKELTSVFNSLGLRSCVLKGQGVAQLYPNPLRRKCGDIDLWVEGNRDDIYEILKTKWNVGKTVIHHADVKIFNDALTEIHFIPSFTYSPLLYRKYKRFFKKTEARQFANYHEETGFSYPTIDFNAVYSLMHIFHHVLHEGVGLRQYLDYYYILRNLGQEQKDQVLDELKYLGLTKFTAAVMYVEQQMFGLEYEFLLSSPNEKLGKRLLADIESFGNFGLYNKHDGFTGHKKGIILYLHNVKRNFAFFEIAPSEVLWAPIWKPCHFVWRKIKGYS